MLTWTMRNSHYATELCCWPLGVVLCWQRELYDLEDKYKKAMMTNAHLDNEKQSLRYQADLLRDKVDDMTEHCTELQRELKDKTRVGCVHEHFRAEPYVNVVMQHCSHTCDNSEWCMILVRYIHQRHDVCDELSVHLWFCAVSKLHCAKAPVMLTRSS